MYATCLFCNRDLGANTVLPTFPIGRRLAFDAERGRLWVVCTRCGRWNLTALEERWEAIEECERLFRQTRLRFSTDNIGLAQLREGVDLVRIGRALRPEIAAWRYGRFLRRWLPHAPGAAVVRAADTLAGAAARVTRRVAQAAARVIPHEPLGYDAATWLRLHRQGSRVAAIVDPEAAEETSGERGVIRYRDLERAELVRPESGEAWQLVVRHDAEVITLTGAPGLRVAGKLLAAVNGVGAPAELVGDAIHKLEDAGDPDGFFNRIVALALRTSWGRFPTAPRGNAPPGAATDAERLALYLTTRSFWGRGGIGSEPRTPLPRLPVVDRLALEMAANEDTERRALEGELAELEAAWREAEEIADIADNLLASRARRLWRMRLRLAGSTPLAAG
jgi:hypothetical protein